jgi:hypothetical protein
MIPVCDFVPGLAAIICGIQFWIIEK